MQTAFQKFSFLDFLSSSLGINSCDLSLSIAVNSVKPTAPRASFITERQFAASEQMHNISTTNRDSSSQTPLEKALTLQLKRLLTNNRVRRRLARCPVEEEQGNPSERKETKTSHLRDNTSGS